MSNAARAIGSLGGETVVAANVEPPINTESIKPETQDAR
jgi:hypothetical protein